MIGGDPSPSSEAGSPEGATFELDRFEWTAPDRLEIVGQFLGLAESSEEAPELLLRSDEGVHRLPAVPGSVSGPPEDGKPWHATFSWQEPPVPFAQADLALGRDLVVELPEPREGNFEDRVLDVGGGPAESGDPALENAVTGPAPDLLSMQAELLAAREDIRELQAAVEGHQRELTRARDDLAAERERHAADAERYRNGLAELRTAGEEALKDAIAAKELALEELRKEREAALAVREEVESKAVADAETLRAELVDAQIAADEARDEAARLRGRLEHIREALGDGA